MVGIEDYAAARLAVLSDCMGDTYTGILLRKAFSSAITPIISEHIILPTLTTSIMCDKEDTKASNDIKPIPTNQSVDVSVGLKDVNLSNAELEIENALVNYVLETNEEKRFVRKLDLIMMPTLWFMYILAYIDRQNIVCIFFKSDDTKCQAHKYFRETPR